MEESIRRAEKLVHATNSALAEMNFNMTFDDFNEMPKSRKPERKSVWNAKTNRKLTLEEELEQFERDFKSETKEMLSRMDKLLDPNQLSFVGRASSQSAKARGKMMEINRKIESQKQRKSASNDDQKLLNLNNQGDLNYLSPGSGNHTFSSRDSETSKKTYSIKDSVQTRGSDQLSPKKTGSLPTIIEKPMSNVKDLKSKLLETQEIVDRGFQTARQLTQRVENLTRGEKKLEKTPSSTKTLFSEPLSLKSEVQSSKSESNETIKIGHTGDRVKCHKASRHDGKEKSKKKDKKEKTKQEKNCLVCVRRPESRMSKKTCKKLQIQRLPSLHLMGGLQIQNIHNLEIVPENKEALTSKANTSILIFSHEQIEKEKNEKILENIKKENCFCSDSDKRENRIECFNCGKLIRIREPLVDPRELDKLLLECNFNVFDPRIDEFVEKYNQTGVMDKIIEKQKRRHKIGDKDFSEEKPEEMQESKMKKSEKVVKKVASKENETNVEPVRKNFKIQELTERLSKEYKEKTLKLEDDHLEFENILKNLFKKVDESREVFDECRLLSLHKRQEKKVQNLTTTKPVVVSYAGDDIEVTKAKIGEVEKRLHECDPSKVKKRKEKLDKRDVINKCKSRTWEEKESKISLKEKKDKTDKYEKQTDNKRSAKISPLVPSLVAEIFNEIHGDQIGKKNAIKNDVMKKVGHAGKTSESSSSSSVIVKSDKKGDASKKSGSENEDKTENDYESDFEGDSLLSLKQDSIRNSEEVQQEEEQVAEEEEEDPGIIRVIKKLSTISEVDSELERKSSKSKNDVAEVDLGKDEMEMPNKNEINNDTKEVLSKAFEKDVSYTLHHQRKALESNQIPEENVFTENGLSIPLSSRSMSEDSIKTKNSKRNNEGENKSDSSLKTNTKGGDPKASKNRLNDSGSQKSSSTEVVASLKEVLSALNDQFLRTRSLADKLTETVNEKKAERDAQKSENGPQKESVTGDNRFLGDTLVTNLRKLRKDLGVDNDTYFKRPKSPLSLSALPRVNDWKAVLGENMIDSRNASQEKERKMETNEGSESAVSENEVLSIGEVSRDKIKATGSASDRKRKGPEKSESSSNSEGSFVRVSSRKKSSRISSAQSSNKDERKISLPLKLGSNKEDESYSEGEIPSNILTDAECSSVQSIGEVISEKISAASSLE